MTQVCYERKNQFNRTQDLVTYLDIDDIDDFPNYPYKVVIDVNMMGLVDSIKKTGVLVPVIVRKKDDNKYEMISGHRRKAASRIAEQYMIPAIIKDLSNDDAIIFAVDSNIHREDILPSEKAFAYKMKMDAIKRKAGRPRKNNVVPLGQNMTLKTSRQLMSELHGESQTQIQRYIRLTELIEPLLQMVDEKKISMRPAVELSYLSKEMQKVLYEYIEGYECTPSHVQAIKMRSMEERGRLDAKAIIAIMSELKGNQKEQIKIPKDSIRKYFKKGTSDKIIQETIIVALEYYRKTKQK